MKEIKAYIRPLCASRVIKALEDAGAKDLTLIQADAIAPLPYHGQETEVSSARHITRHSDVAKLELVCRDKEAKLYVEIIRACAHTGKRGDGRIFVSHVEEAVNIRTGETSDTAL
ncbi:MAG: P-II family nitrogen regulator [Verrucomicrobiota bacterium]